MKYAIIVILTLFFVPTTTLEAQTNTRAGIRKVRKERRAKRRVVRRVNRRVVRRTLRRLPANTRPLVYRNATFYPVGGMYFVKRNRAYVRAFPPRGFRLRRLPATALALTVRGVRYRYAAGVFYRAQENDEFEVTDAPVGAVVPELPEDATEIDFDGIPAYELNEAVYKAVEDGYEVIDVVLEEKQ